MLLDQQISLKYHWGRIVQTGCGRLWQDFDYSLDLNNTQSSSVAQSCLVVGSELLSNKFFSVMHGDASSSRALLFCGVPQGSILSPLLFTINMLPLRQIMHRHDIDFHSYMNDTLLYVPLKPGTSDVSRIMSCLTEIKKWMSKNVLQLNADQM